MKNATIKETGKSLIYKDDNDNKKEFKTDLEFTIVEYETLEEVTAALQELAASDNESAKDFALSNLNSSIKTRASYKALRYALNKQRGVDYEKLPAAINLAWAYSAIIGGKVTHNKKLEAAVMAHVQLSAKLAQLTQLVESGIVQAKQVQAELDRLTTEIEENTATQKKLQKLIDEAKAARAATKKANEKKK